MPTRKSILWSPPKNFADRQDERKISWLELFYDLVYAAVISQLASHLAQHTAWNELGYFSFLFALVYWSWMNGSLYSDIHGSDGIRARYFTLLQMLAMAAVAITLKDVFEGRHQTFAVAFLIVQTIITFLWWSTGYYDPTHRPLNKYYVRDYSLGIILFAISIFTTYRIAFILWSVALTLNLATGIIAWPSNAREMRKRGDVFSISSTFVERLGQFTIIVLAETIFGIVSGISAIADKTMVVWVAFIIAILIAFFLWWIYFDMLADQKAKPGYQYYLLFTLVHLPMLAGFGAVGACIKTILYPGDPEVYASAKWIFCDALSIILICISILSHLMEKNEETLSYIGSVARLLLVVAVAIIVVAIFNGYLTTLTFLSILAGLLLIPIYVGARKWVNYILFNASP